MTDKPRLIEHAFPLKQASLDSVHEKNVRHGHISTLHIWPARRPLAACRAALIATLLPDPGDPKKRKELVEKIGGRVVEKIERKKMPSGKIVENIKEETVGGILHWKRETENKETLDWFRDEIKKAYGGKAPKVLDPFAGGGAIPLEAMRLGCEATAIDINPVAWFILKCTLEYPQKLAGQKRPLPDFILKDRDFMEAFFKSQGFKGALLRTQLEKLGFGKNDQPLLSNFPVEDPLLEADLAWHVRAWGKWVLNQAREDLAKYYPTYADFEPLKDSGNKYKKRKKKLVPLRDYGIPDIDSLNAEFDNKYLEDKTNPRWIAKPTVAYLWARTVKCKNCRATVPLLKTRWLCKKASKRVLLTMEPNKDKTGVVFGVQSDVPVKGGNAAQRREHDKRIGGGTMSRSGAQCPFCPAIMTMADIRLEGKAGRLRATMTVVAVDGQKGKEYRLPAKEEIQRAEQAVSELNRIFDDIAFGLPEEPLPTKEALGFRVPLYGFDQWRKLFTPRQLLTMATFVRKTHLCRDELSLRYPKFWVEAITAYLACVLSRTADYMATLCVWENGAEEVKHVFMRWALPVTWDFAEGNPLAPIKRFYNGGLNSAFQVLSSLHNFSWGGILPPIIKCESALKMEQGKADLIFTDPPYYDAIPYSDLMDFFYIWLKRVIEDLNGEFEDRFSSLLGPKWNREKNDGELIDDDSRHDGNSNASKECYENGMYTVFRSFYKKLSDNGRAVVVFANKNANAWETLVASIIRAGFCVTSSWPIATEMPGGLRNLNRASLASSIWLVCKKRPLFARPGWDNKVLEEMRENIKTQLRDFWDAGIRGPDFVWAATGPALEAYSKHPVVKKANEPGQLMEVSEFLRHVRRMVVDFVVGRVISHDGESKEVSGLDDVTTYYLLHRHDFGIKDAPVGPCILYAVSCGLTDRALVGQFDMLAKTGGKTAPEPDKEAASNGDVGGGTGSTLKLKQWNQRKRQSMGYDPAVDSAKAQAKAAQTTFLPVKHDENNAQRREIPLIDQVHRVMQLWKSGELVKVDDYLDSRALLRNNTFHQVLQALIELADTGSEERSILESISNHLKARGVTVEDKQQRLL
jgi:adenine-specific DNA methylase